MARMLVLCWYFLLLILTQSYTASLASILTVKRYEPTLSSFHELKDTGSRVGYPKDSFLFEHMKQTIGDESRLQVYNTRDDLHKAFSNGSIVAAFDEVPYMKIFLGKYCSKYKLLEPAMMNTNGLGLVFPKGSPLVPDVSRAVLEVIQSDKMKRIEREWFGEETKCPDPSTSLASTTLGIDTFWLLFVIVGAVAGLAFITFVAAQWIRRRLAFNAFEELKLRIKENLREE